MRHEVRQHARRPPSAALLRDPARRPGARRRPVPAGALSRRSTPPRWRAGAACRMPSWRSRSSRSTSTTSRRPTCARCAAGPTPREVFGTRRDRAAAAARARRVVLEALSNGPTLAFKDMAMQLLGNAVRVRAGAPRRSTLNILGATSGDTGSAAEYAMRGKRGVRVFMLSPHGRMSPFQQAQMFSLQDAEHPQHRDRRRVRRLPGHRQGGLERPGVQARAQASAPSTRSTGRAWWRRWSTTSPATSRRRERTTSEVELRRAVRQLRQHLRRPRRAHDGPADPHAGARHQRERRARRVLPHRPLPRAQQRRDARDLEPVDGHLARRRTSSASSSTCSAATPARTRELFGRGRAATASSRSTPARARAHRRLRLRVSGRSTHADRLATIRDTHGSASAT